MTVLQVGERMPELQFTTVDPAGAAGGNRQVALSDYRGKRVLLFVWAGW